MRAFLKLARDQADAAVQSNVDLFLIKRGLGDWISAKRDKTKARASKPPPPNDTSRAEDSKRTSRDGAEATSGSRPEVVHQVDGWRTIGGRLADGFRTLPV